MPTQFLYPNQSTRSDQTASKWHLWSEKPPNPTVGWVRCRLGGIESLVDAGCHDVGWPHKGVRWKETDRCKPLRVGA